ncbi:hypothetical protein FNF28_07702 [Cafeteria roenbergensis]|uniref:Uncharacterized protein n=1 Tax=Cafeteria roenbergensis TaxID=33653 RepID=A0A5A8C0S6_CAFRO|nr:hypothetical protein FNF28_07702 [Cafeteria roenbergensis]
MQRAAAFAAATAAVCLVAVACPGAQGSPQLQRLLERTHFSRPGLTLRPFWQLAEPSATADGEPTAGVGEHAAAQTLGLDVAPHSRVFPAVQGAAPSARVAVTMPAAFAPFVVFDYLASLGAQARVTVAVYRSVHQLRRTLVETLGLCSGRPAARRDTIALVIPPRLHGNSLAAIDECKHDRNVWVWNTEQLTNPAYLALTSVLMQQGWRVVDMLAQNRCLAWSSLCERGALGAASCRVDPTAHAGAEGCPSNDVIRGAAGDLLLAAASGCAPGAGAPKLGLVCHAPRQRASKAALPGAGAEPETVAAALRVVPYQLTSEVDRLRELLRRTALAGRTHDVAFVGTVNWVRNIALVALVDKNVSVVVANGDPSERDRTIASARVLVNAHRGPDNFVFESLRCDRWIAAGHIVVSEPSWGDDTNDLRGAYVTSPEPTPHSLAATVVRVLSDLEGTRARLSAVLSERLESVRAARAAALASWLADD